MPIVFLFLVSGFQFEAGLRIIQCSEKLQVLGAKPCNSDSRTPGYSLRQTHFKECVSMFYVTVSKTKKNTLKQEASIFARGFNA